MPSDRRSGPRSSNDGPAFDFQALKRQLRENERIWNGFRQVELGMLGAQSLRELVDNLVRDIPRLFPNVDCVTLACIDPDLELARHFETDGDIRPSPVLLPISADVLASLFPMLRQPRLGPMEDAVRQLLFPAVGEGLKSMALAPLVLRGELIGCLNQASRDPGHFRPDTGTDLLEHLAAVAAMCIDNAVIHERLRIDGLTDPLTELYNRRFFERRLHEELDRWARRPGNSLVGMLVDVDHFKRINDQHGHHAGDRILQGVARLLGKELRGSDVLARYGGEEFVLLLPDTTEDQGFLIAERLRALVEEASLGETVSQPQKITVSVGLACLSAMGDPAADDAGAWLLQKADAALYQAKQRGRNRVVRSKGGKITPETN